MRVIWRFVLFLTRCEGFLTHAFIYLQRKAVTSETFLFDRAILLLRDAYVSFLFSSERTELYAHISRGKYDYGRHNLHRKFVRERGSLTPNCMFLFRATHWL